MEYASQVESIFVLGGWIIEKENGGEKKGNGRKRQRIEGRAKSEKISKITTRGEGSKTGRRKERGESVGRVRKGER